jgi:hypothetical protein
MTRMTEQQTEKKHRDSKWLWIWLIILASYSSLVLGNLASFQPNIINSLLDFAPEILIEHIITALAVTISSVIFVVASWRWKKWGIWGIYGMAIATSAIIWTEVSESGSETLFAILAGFIEFSLTMAAVLVVRHYWKNFVGMSQQSNTVETRLSLNRSVFLSLWVIFLVFFYLMSGMYDTVMTEFSELTTVDVMPKSALIFVSVTFVFAIAGLMWKKWGFVGLGAIAVISALIVAFLPPYAREHSAVWVGWLTLTIAFVVLLVVLLRPVWKQLKWR